MAVNEPSAGSDVTQGEAGTALHGKSGVSPAMGGTILPLLLVVITRPR
jgi:hypothetical protein